MQQQQDEFYATKKKLPEDFLGKKFGNWVVKSLTIFKKGLRQHQYLLCSCPHLEERYVNYHSLLAGRTSGCLLCMGDSNKTKQHLWINGGDKFGDWEVISPVYVNGKYLLCRCVHHREGIPVKVGNLTSGESKGCHQCFVERNTTRTKQEKYWRTRFCNLRARCYNKNNPTYHRYGGRGIRVCDAWLSDVGEFVRYVVDVLGGDISKSIDRINNDGDYCPGNIRLADSKQQARNTSKTRKVIWKGKEYVLKDFIKECTKYSWSHAHRLLKEGATIEWLIDNPPKKRL